MREPEIGSYHDADGARHKLVVRQSADGDWRVLDIDVTADTAQIVETLTDDHGRPSAGRGGRPRLPDHRRRARGTDGTGGRRGHT